MEILVTGGNGFLGHHAVQALLDRGDRVRVLALPGEDVSWLEERGVAVHRGDICCPETLATPMQGAEAVLHLAAMMHVWRPVRDYVAVNVTGTENVCKVALTVGVRRLVHMSSSSVYGMAWDVPVDERFPLSPFHDPYPISKAEGDRLVQRMVAEEGLPAAIIRPDQMFGPGDRLHFGRIADRLRAGEAFNITNDAPLTQQELLQAIAHEIDAKPPRLHVPYHALYAAAYAAERLPAARRTWHRPPITRLGVAFLGTDIRYSIDKARRELGYAPRVTLQEGVRLAAAWHRGAARGDPPRLLPDRRPRSRPGKGDTVDGLANEVAIVTGASSGIGAATACELARRGARVVLAARRVEELRAQAEAISAVGGEAVSIPTDVADPQQLSRLVEGTEASFGSVDVLVNNAGANWLRPVVATAPDELVGLLEVNLLGAMLLTRAVLPGMLERRHGAIVFVGSLSGRVATEPVYSATKYGLRGFSLGLRRQLAGSGVSVSLVSPGNIRTDMTRQVQGRLPEPLVVAEEICELVRRPRREVVVPRRHHAIAWLEQTLPTLADLAHRYRHWSPVE